MNSISIWWEFFASSMFKSYLFLCVFFFFSAKSFFSLFHCCCRCLQYEFVIKSRHFLWTQIEKARFIICAVFLRTIYNVSNCRNFFVAVWLSMCTLLIFSVIVNSFSFNNCPTIPTNTLTVWTMNYINFYQQTKWIVWGCIFFPVEKQQQEPKQQQKNTNNGCYKKHNDNLSIRKLHT